MTDDRITGRAKGAKPGPRQLARIKPAQVAAPRADALAPPPAGPPPDVRVAGWSARRPLMIGGVMLAILLGGFGAWAASTTISGAIIAPGRFAVASNRQVVQHPDGGVVAEVHVKEGDRVAKGDVLVTLDPTFLASQIAIAEGRLTEIRARRARLEAERDEQDAIRFPPDLLAKAEEDPEVAELMEGQRTLFEARNVSEAGSRTQLERRTEQIAAQIVGIDAQSEALEEQLSLMEEELATTQSLLDRGLAQAPRVLSLRREAARLRGTVGQLAADRARGEAQITETELQIITLATNRREAAITELRDIRAEELQLTEQLRAQQAQFERLAIAAPVGGVVYGMTIFGTGSVVRPADPVLFIVPQDEGLVIEARVEPIHVDQVYPGQPVRLMLSAFDARTTPELNGEVRSLSPDAFDDERSGAPYYRAEIVLKEGEAGRLRPNQILIPGMPAEAFIRTSDRTPLAYLTGPLTDYFVRAFREGGPSGAPAAAVPEPATVPGPAASG